MDTKKLRAEIARVTKPDGRRHFGKELRAKVLKAVFLLRESGASHTKIADELSISTMTVGRYLRGELKSRAVARPVAVASPRPVTVAPKGSLGSKVTTPSGFEVEGLEVDDIIVLIRSLS